MLPPTTATRGYGDCHDSRGNNHNNSGSSDVGVGHSFGTNARSATTVTTTATLKKVKTHKYNATKSDTHLYADSHVSSLEMAAIF